MNKLNKLTVICLTLFLGIFAISCDNESVDPLLDNNKKVGKPVVYVNTDGVEDFFRENVVAKINAKGEMHFTLDAVKGEKKDVLTIMTKTFKQGNFPTNANRSTYLDRENNQYFSTIDIDRPTYITGFVTIDFINRSARVVSGSFDMRMIPVKPEGEDANVDPSIRSFQVKGTFENVPYEREESEYVDAQIDGAEFRNTNATLEENDTNYIVMGVGRDNVDQVLHFTFPKERAVVGEVIKMSEEGVDAYYFSEFGIKYTLDKEDEAMLKDAQIEIEEVEKFIEKVDGTEVERTVLKGSFDMKLKGVDEEKRVIQVKYGTFKVSKK
ncbi:hypothetical protein GJV76_07510 [Myroides sp. BIT-d1]|uniref:Uncharacterized protein n=1 Tax=Myroides albus TaxID=2562892 RepID=A0A6I3LK86_9FLAO|nr:hypothetical protein [Myroides albus]MTG97986.1 hypothetical protein [Myroides albus]